MYPAIADKLSKIPPKTRMLFFPKTKYTIKMYIAMKINAVPKSLWLINITSEAITRMVVGMIVRMRSRFPDRFSEK